MQLNNKMKTLIYAAVAAFCSQLDPTPSELADIKCAVSEAITNCIVHAYRHSEGLIYITVSLLEGRVAKIEIRDKGCGIEDVKEARQPLFTTDAASKFNEETKDSESVYYMSYAFAMKKAYSDIFMWFPNLMIGILEGKNDGLLTPDSVKWGNFRGVYQGAGRRGISHCDEIDMRRRPLILKIGDRTLDILDFYTEIVSELANKGY